VIAAQPRLGTVVLGRPLLTTLPGGPPSPGLARAALVDHFGETLADDALETLKLLCSEVVTNCVQHAGASTGVLIEMRVWELSGAVHVEVSTATRSFRHRSGEPRPGPGHGLRIVEALARSWGIVENGRNTVWFKVDTAGAEA
jgi:anti-sigma regulatory factor (Ser/Thr protein kinase)